MTGFLADIIVILHFLFVLFVIFGALFLLLSKKFIWLHLPAAIWGAFIEYTGWICPLTPLENRLRFEAGEGVYEGGFVENYIIPVLYPEALTRNLQILLGTLVIVINLTLYWIAFRIRARNQNSNK
jgi:Protein of Unknown function (DUF2784)